MRETPIAGVAVLDIERVVDQRGFFARTFDAAALERVGLIRSFDQQSIAYNEVLGTVRGLHYQVGVVPEAKIVRCTRGRIYDVAVDLRAQSPTFGRWFALELNDHNRTSLYIPPGCAHGYQTLSNDAEVLYLISAPYQAEHARGIYYADPHLAIPWPLPVSRISERDLGLPHLSEERLT